MCWCLSELSHCAHHLPLSNNTTSHSSAGYPQLLLTMNLLSVTLAEKLGEIGNLLDYYLKKSHGKLKSPLLTMNIIKKFDLTQALRKMNKYDFQIRDLNRALMQSTHFLIWIHLCLETLQQ